MHDLEIRGTGEILGDSQSGNIQEVGFSMYNEMLNEAVRALKAGEEPDLDAPFNLACEVNLHAPALLPSDYCPDVHGRLAIYKRLSHADGEDDLIRIQEELIDRFGKLPEAAQTLLATHRLRLAAQPLGIVKIDASETRALLQFGAKTTVDPCASSSWCSASAISTVRPGQTAGGDQGASDRRPRRRRARRPARTEITAALGAAGILDP